MTTSWLIDNCKWLKQNDDCWSPSVSPVLWPDDPTCFFSFFFLTDAQQPGVEKLSDSGKRSSFRRVEESHRLPGADSELQAIVLSGIIGTGVSVTNIDALELVGPAGLLVALAVLGVITISVGETISHLVQLFPAPNAIFEYVYNFVDEELAWVIGFLYW